MAEEFFEPEEFELDLDLGELDQFIATENKLANRRELVGAERRSRPVLGKLAQARLIQMRAAQINNGERTTLPPDVAIVSGDSVEIAKQELVMKVIPFKIVRVFPNNTFEKWDIREFKYFN